MSTAKSVQRAAMMKVAIMPREQLEQLVRELWNGLWPEGLEEAEWSGDTAGELAQRFHTVGLHPADLKPASQRAA